MNNRKKTYKETIAEQGYLIVKGEREANIAATELAEQVSNGSVIGTRRGKSYFFARKDWFEQHEDASLEGEAARVVNAFYDEMNPRNADSPAERKTSTHVPANAVFFIDQFAEPFARVSATDVAGTHAEVHKIRSRAFRRIVTAWLMDAHLKPTQSNIADLISVCEAKAITSGAVFPLYNRYAVRNDKIFIDLGSQSWEAVEISRDGWRKVPSSDIDPPLFRRYSHFRAIEVGSSGAREDLEAFLALLNVKPADRILYSALLVSKLIPGYPHFIEVLIGAQGAAKSTSQKYTRMLVDNSEIPLLSMPNKQEQLTQLLMHHYAPTFDNVDNLYDWQSDMLCRAVTGEGITKRELYSDDDDVVYKYRRCIGMNGINIMVTKADLNDRSLAMEVERIDESERKAEFEIEKRFADLAPNVTAYMYGVVSKALSTRDQVAVELQGKLKRMADALIWGEACARAIGYSPMEFFNSCVGKIQGQSEEILKSSIVGALVIPLLEADPTYASTGTVEIEPLDFYTTFRQAAAAKQLDKDKGFPKASNALTRKLNALKPNLAEYGIKFEVQHSGARKYLFKQTGRIPSKASDRPPTDDKGLGRYLDGSKSASSNSVHADAIEASATNTVHDTVHSSSDDNGRKDGMDGILPTSYTSSVNSREASPEGQDHFPNGDGACSPQEASPPGQPTTECANCHKKNCTLIDDSYSNTPRKVCLDCYNARAHANDGDVYAE